MCKKSKINKGVSVHSSKHSFATCKSDGNPAGYIRLNSFDDINDEDMLKIASELKGFVSEVVI